MRKALVDDEQHFEDCHKRWSQRVNRDQKSTDYKDEWYGQQCLFCRYFVPLVGAFAEDYGVCTNQLSQFDGVVRFEHDGCDQYDEADEHWSAKDEFTGDS